MEIPPTERLHFRFLTAADTDLFFELDQDPEVMKYINGGFPSTRQTIADWYVPRLASYADQEKGWGLWGVFLAADDRFLGWILVRPMHFFTGQRDDRDLEIGWRFFRSTWGQGYATEAARAVAEQLEVTNACDRITAHAKKENAASVNVMQKLGMTFVREYEDPEAFGDKLCSVYSRPIAS